MHWTNAFAVIIMTLSGWRIYDATNFLGFGIPDVITLGGWLGGALLWHFAAMWVLGINAIAYIVMNIITKRLWTRFFPFSPRSIWQDTQAFLKGTLSHADLSHYNAVQKVLYVSVMFAILAVILSGLVLFKSVQFPLLRELMFGYEGARRVHFIAMTFLTGFFIVHVFMSLLVPKSLKAMITGA